jgi:hypothetical protein
VSNGLLRLSYEGGSRDLWNIRTSWRWDGRRFVLIRACMRFTDTVAGRAEPGFVQRIDVDFSRRRAAKTVTQKKGPSKVVRCRVKAEFAAPELAAFRFEENDLQDGLSCL